MISAARGRGGRLLLAAGLAAAFFVCLGPIANPDLPWHLAVGRRIAATWAVPRSDFLSWTMAGHPWVDPEWGSQLIFHALDRAGGNGALWAFKCAEFAVLIALLAAMLRLWAMSDAWIGLAAPAFTGALFPFIDARPETWTLLLVLLQFYLLERRRLGALRVRRGALLAGHAVLYAVWANLHPGFPVGLALCACYGAGEAVREKRGVPLPFLLAAAGLAGTLLNPYGPGLYAVFPAHWKELSSIRRLIIEWAPPNFRNQYENGYWALILFSFGGFLYAEFRGEGLPAEHLASVVVFALFSSRSFRTTPFAMLILFPLALRALQGAAAPPRWGAARPWVLAAAFAAGSWRLGGFIREQRYLRTFDSPERVLPSRACAFLRAEKGVLSGLPMFNSYNLGGYLDQHLFPDYRVFMDGRYLFAGLLARSAEAQKNPFRWRAFMEEYGVQLALLENTGHMIRSGHELPRRAFDAYAMPRRDWALVYWDSTAMILVRRDKVPAAWLKTREFRYLRPHDLPFLGLRIMSGEARQPAVAAEIERYAREIGDPIQVALLARWFTAFRRGLAAAQPKLQRR